MPKTKLSKMDPIKKKIWVDALRSGEFKQGKSFLIRDEYCEQKETKHCCLGVLCEVRKKITHKRVWDKVIMRRHALLNGQMLEWAGLNDETQKKLAGFNDNGRSFRWIAAYIERYL